MQFRKEEHMPKVTIASARVNAGYTQAEFAKIIGVSLPALQKWESGKADMRVSSLKKISEATGFSMDDFILPTEYA